MPVKELRIAEGGNGSFQSSFSTGEDQKCQGERRNLYAVQLKVESLSTFPSSNMIFWKVQVGVASCLNAHILTRSFIPFLDELHELQDLLKNDLLLFEVLIQREFKIWSPEAIGFFSVIASPQPSTKVMSSNAPLI
jgi:hypothetical protein